MSAVGGPPFAAAPWLLVFVASSRGASGELSIPLGPIAVALAAVAIGLVGLSSSFGALVLARRREFGVLRHLGMTRRQIGTMLATEGIVTSAIGLAIGLALGFVISLILIHVVNRQSFHWGMELSLPWPALLGFGTLLLGLSMITALASGRGAMGDEAVHAVKDDW